MMPSMEYTQLAISLPQAAPLRAEPTIATRRCPVRDACLVAILAARADYVCGFEQAGSVYACPKMRGYDET